VLTLVWLGALIALVSYLLGLWVKCFRLSERIDTWRSGNTLQRWSVAVYGEESQEQIQRRFRGAVLFGYVLGCAIALLGAVLSLF
jgi:hypothetical protein